MHFNNKYTNFKSLFIFIIFSQVSFAVSVQSITNSYLIENAFSGATTTPNVAVIDSNPAILAVLKKPSVYIGGSYINTETVNNNAKATNAFGPVKGDTSSTGKSQTEIPNLFLSLPTESPVSLGLSITSAWDLNSEYSDKWVGRNLSTILRLQSLNITPVVAVEVTPQFSIGLGWHIQKNKFNSKVELPLYGWSENSGTSWSYGYTLGTLYKFTSKTSVGLSYDHYSKINFNTSGLFPSKVYIQFPDVINLGFRYSMNKNLRIMVNLQETLWKQFYLKVNSNLNNGITSTSNTNINFKNNHLLSLGMEYDINHKNTLELGIGLDDGMYTTSNYRVWLSTGLHHYFTKDCSVDIGYIYGSKQTGTVSTTNINSLTSNGEPIGEVINTLSMNSSSVIQIISVGFHYRF